MKRILTSPLLLLLTALAIAGVFYITPLYRGYETLRLLHEVGSNTSLSLEQQSIRTSITFPVEAQPFMADLYRTQKQPRAAIILQHGAAKAGKDDERLIRFASQLAGAGFLVMVPEMPGARELQVSSADIPVLRYAVEYLQHSTPVVEGPIGIVGFSVAAGLALHAAMLPELRERIAFIMAVGGYYDLPQTLTYMTTGYFPLDGVMQHLPANTYGKWVFVLSNVERISDPVQRELLRQIASQKIAATSPPSSAVLAQLTGEALHVYRFVENTVPERSRQLRQQLPASLQAEIERLDLANKDLSALKAQLILVHGLNDRIIPYTQSVALHQALPPSQSQLYLLRNWTHVDPDDGVLDAWQMFRALYRLLELRDLRSRP